MMMQVLAPAKPAPEDRNDAQHQQKQKAHDGQQKSKFNHVPMPIFTRFAAIYSAFARH